MINVIQVYSVVSENGSHYRLGDEEYSSERSSGNGVTKEET